MNPVIVIPTCKTPYEIAPLMCNLEGFSQGCRVVATCEKVSAAINRNRGIRGALYSDDGEKAPEIIIMLDDDIAGFYPGWWQDLIKPLDDPGVVLVSARLMGLDGKPGPMMFGGDYKAENTTQVPRVPTACIAFRSEDVEKGVFDEGFIGSGFEDDDFCAKLAKKFPAGRVVINNRCKLIHVNEQKNQGGEIYAANKKRFDGIWRTIRAGTVRCDRFWNIPKMLHFVWIGKPMPKWAAANIEEFRRLNPCFEVMVHKESVLNPIFSKHWNRINHPVHGLAIKSDLLRLSALMQFGGWYFDTDFWPLVSIESMCDQMEDCYQKTLLFATPDRKICANGAIGCSADATGLTLMVERVLSRIEPHPDWWDYGTRCAKEVLENKKYAGHYCVQPLDRIIPYVGKEAALKCMRSVKAIEETKNKGHWAIHFEMTTSTDIEGELCTTANLVKTSS